MSVYVVQNHASYNKNTGMMESRFDLSPAEKFGELVFLLSPITVPNNPVKVIAELREKLRNFSDEDHLLLIGNPCLIGFCVAVAADINEGKVSMLVYNGAQRVYRVVRAEDLIEMEG
jgi:hypothetical protein